MGCYIDVTSLVSNKAIACTLRIDSNLQRHRAVSAAIARLSYCFISHRIQSELDAGRFFGLHPTRLTFWSWWVTRTGREGRDPTRPKASMTLTSDDNAQYTPPTPTRRDKTVSSRRRRRCILGLSNHRIFFYLKWLTVLLMCWCSTFSLQFRSETPQKNCKIHILDIRYFDPTRPASRPDPCPSLNTIYSYTLPILKRAKWTLLTVTVYRSRNSYAGESLKERSTSIGTELYGEASWVARLRFCQRRDITARLWSINAACASRLVVDGAYHWQHRSHLVHGDMGASTQQIATESRKHRRSSVSHKTCRQTFALISQNIDRFSKFLTIAHSP